MDHVFGIAQTPKYAWEVDNVLLELASQFIDTFNALFDEELARPEPEEAPLYWEAYKHNEILGRCVRLGFDDRVSPRGTITGEFVTMPPVNLRCRISGTQKRGRPGHTAMPLARMAALQYSAMGVFGMVSSPEHSLQKPGVVLCARK